MDNQMMSMEELKQIAGGNMFNDAWNWICDQMNTLDRYQYQYQPHDWPIAEYDDNY